MQRRTERTRARTADGCNPNAVTSSGAATRSKLGADRQRPWLVVNNESHPFSEEQFVAVAVSTTEYDESLPLDDDVWVNGGVPRESFVSPWAVHSPRIEDLVAWQGRVTDAFVDDVVDELEGYVE